MQDLHRAWHDRKSRAIGYHHARTGDVTDWVYYDPWELRKISSQVALSRENTTRVIPDDVIVGWEHDDSHDDVERTPGDESHEYNATVYGDEPAGFSSSGSGYRAGN